MLPALPEPVRAEPMRLRYLGPRDEAWLDALLELFRAYQGRRRVELRERLTEPLGVRAPRQKLRLAVQVLEREVPDLQHSTLPSPEVRARVFRAASERAPRAWVLEQVARELGCEASEVERALLADLAGERKLGALPADFSAPQLALRVNRALVVHLLKRATLLRFTTRAPDSPLVARARRLGLIASTARGQLGGVVLEVSGPFSLFQRTSLYGRALASLLPLSPGAGFDLLVHCQLQRAAAATFAISDDDPIFPGAGEPPAVEGAEARLARAFAGRRSPWRLEAAPAPLAVQGALLCPDFELVHRRDGARRWCVELLGFWTPPYVADKLRLYAAAGRRVLLCVDLGRRCSAAELAPTQGVLGYRGRLTARALLAALGT